MICIRTVLATLALAGLSSGPVVGDDEGKGLGGVRSFAYVLQAERLGKKRAQAIEALRGCGRDLLVVDVSFEGDEESRWTAAEINRIRSGAPGRIVLAYFSIGEAEDYRAYWKPAWKTSPPGFLLEENPDWEGNYLVKYWDPGWQEIILRDLDRIVSQGFDGIYLDLVSAFENFEYDPKKDKWIDHRRNPDTGRTFREDMSVWVKRLASHGRKKKGRSFRVVPQNGEQLLVVASYRETIDAIGVEDLFTNGKRPQKAAEVAYRRGFLEKLSRKPVFCIEYPKSDPLRELAWKQAAASGYRLLVTDRGLKTLGESGAPPGR